MKLLIWQIFGDLGRIPITVLRKKKAITKVNVVDVHV